MAFVRGSRLAALFVGMTFAVTLPHLAAPQSKSRHPGQVQEVLTRRPLPADVKAWPDEARSGSDGDCPTYGKSPIDITRAEPSDGRFAINIDAAVPSFRITYCLSGFVPRADIVPNRKPGSAVIPTPAQLSPLQQGGSTAELPELIVFRAIAALNDLSYLSASNPEIFNKTIEGLAGDLGRGNNRRGQIVNSLAGLARAWQGNQ